MCSIVCMNGKRCAGRALHAHASAGERVPLERVRALPSGERVVERAERRPLRARRLQCRQVVVLGRLDRHAARRLRARQTTCCRVCASLTPSTLDRTARLLLGDGDCVPPVVDDGGSPDEARQEHGGEEAERLHVVQSAQVLDAAGGRTESTRSARTRRRFARRPWP